MCSLASEAITITQLILIIIFPYVSVIEWSHEHQLIHYTASPFYFFWPGNLSKHFNQHILLLCGLAYDQEIISYYYHLKLNHYLPNLYHYHLKLDHYYLKLYWIYIFWSYIEFTIIWSYSEFTIVWCYSELTIIWSNSEFTFVWSYI